MKDKLKLRLIFAAAFAVILITEVLIALFVKDNFIRPYGGDILVTILLCCGVRIFFPRGRKLLPFWVFLFSVAVEFAQYINIVALLGLEKITFLKILIGNSFSWLDILCYATGCAVFFIVEAFINHKKEG